MWKSARGRRAAEDQGDGAAAADPDVERAAHRARVDAQLAEVIEAAGGGDPRAERDRRNAERLSRALLERRLASLFREVRDLIARDAPLPPAAKTNVGLLIASTPIPLPMVARDVGSGTLAAGRRTGRSSRD